jgi:hypothetical protein
MPARIGQLVRYVLLFVALAVVGCGETRAVTAPGDAAASLEISAR